MSKRGGMSGMQYNKKSFMVPMGGNGGADVKHKQYVPPPDKSIDISIKINETKKVRVVPYGDRILVKRRRIGEKLGSIIIAADETKERPTDLADVVYMPELTFVDKELVENAQAIVSSLTLKAKEGDHNAVKSLLLLNDYLKIKAIKVGDAVMISKYVGVDFHDNAGGGNLTLVNGSDIIGLVVNE